MVDLTEFEQVLSMMRPEAAKVFRDVALELARAEAKFPGFNSAHEGYAIIKEEVDELWDHVKGDTAYGIAAYDEAKQIAAMGIRFMFMVLGKQR
jgi:hypothetical protein